MGYANCKGNLSCLSTPINYLLDRFPAAPMEGDAFRNPIMQALAGNSTKLRANAAKLFASRRLPSLAELPFTDRAGRPVRAASCKRAARDCHASAGGHASRGDPNVCSGNSDGRDTSNRHDH